MTLTRCPQCASPLPVTAAGEYCPRCAGRLLLAAADTEDSTTAPATSGTLRLGEYELGAELGRGAMGVVHRARQPRLRREVAVKVILASRFVGESARKRFLAEAELAAQLDHPNIVPIYEVGVTEDGPFYAMKLIEGGTLAGLIEDGRLKIADGNKSMPSSILHAPSSVAVLLAKLARAVHHAHERGVLHRDLKPGNILLDADGEPHITDFGLARQLGADSSLTLTGTTLGTPAYMSPEQATGERGVTTATDIWSLGAIFFHLLTGRPPFSGATATDVLLQVRTQDPPRLRSLRTDIPADLETICLKCLEKDPARRYTSARRLAEDLERWQRHEPIEARPSTPVERLGKWVRRHPARAAVIVAFHILLLVGVAGVLWQWRRAEHIAEESRDRLVRLHQNNAQRAVDETGEPTAALPWLAAALIGEPADSPRRSVISQNLASVLHDAVLPEQVWQLQHHASGVQVSPDGAWVAAHEGGTFAQVWDIRTGQALFPRDHLVGSYALTFSPDNRRIALGGSGNGRIYELPSGKEINARLQHQAPVTHLTFSADSRWVATASGDQTARIWDATTGKPVTEPLQHRKPLSHVAFSPNGRLLATVAEGLFLWEIATGRELGRWETDAFAGVGFSPDGRQVLCPLGMNKPWVYEAETLRPVGQPIASGWIQAAVFSPDGLRAVSEVDGGARVWDVLSGQALTPLLTHGGKVYCLAFSPDGRSVATGGRNGKARVWDATTGEPLTPWLWHGGLVDSVQFTPDGQRLVTGSHDGTARVWPWRRSPAREFVLAGQTNVLVQVWAASDQPRLLTLDRTGSIRLWSSETGQPLTPECGDGTPRASFRISPDGKRFLAGGMDAVQVWDIETGAPGPRIKREIPGLGMEWHPRDHSILEGASTARINEWDAVSGARGRVFQTYNTVSPAISGPGGFAAADGDKVTVWDADSSDHRSSAALPDANFKEVRFSPDGRSLAAMTGDGRVALFDTASVALKFEPLRHTGPIDHFAFTRDSQRLATAGEDGVVRIWESATGRQLAPTLRPLGGANRVAFSPNDRRLATSAKFTGQIWDLATGLPLTLQLKFESELVGEAYFTADSSSVVFVSRDARVFRRELAAPNLAGTDWQFAAALISGHTVTEKGDLLAWQPGPETETSWRRLRERLAPLGASSAATPAPAATADDATMRAGSNAVGVSIAALRFRPWTNNCPQRAPTTPPHLIDLTTYYNFNLTDSMHEAPVDNSFSALKPGVQRLKGVDFDIRGLIHLAGEEGVTHRFPALVSGIEIGRKANQVHFLHSCGWRAPDKTQIGRFMVHYTGGIQREIPIIYGEDVRDWHARSGEPGEGANAKVAWEGSNASSQENRIRLFKTTWTNPLPDTVIVSIDYESTRIASAPFLLAITTEE